MNARFVKIGAPAVGFNNLKTHKENSHFSVRYLLTENVWNLVSLVKSDRGSTDISQIRSWFFIVLVLMVMQNFKQVTETQITLAVVLTVYNAEAYIKNTLQNLKLQRVLPDEIIIVDDCSTDNSLQICRDLMGETQNVVIVSKEKNEGPGVARNIGLERCTSDYVLFLDDDDIFTTELVTVLKSNITSSKPDVCCFLSQEISDNFSKPIFVPWYIKRENLPNKKLFSPDEVKSSIFNSFVGWAWDKVFKREFIIKNNLLFPSLRNSEDLVFTYLALALSKTIYFLDEVLVFHRVNRQGSVSSRLKDHPWDFYSAIILTKSRLKNDKLLWDKFEHDFLIWAMHFTLWVGYFLKNNEVQKALIKKELTELELDRHSIDFFAYYPLDQFLLANLNSWNKRSFRFQVVLRRILSCIQNYGIKYLCKRLLLRCLEITRLKF